jgi:hypothetical protein
MHDIDAIIIPKSTPWWHVKRITITSGHRSTLPRGFTDLTFETPNRKFLWLSEEHGLRACTLDKGDGDAMCYMVSNSAGYKLE